MTPEALAISSYMVDALDSMERDGKTPTEALLEMAKRVSSGQQGYGNRVQALGYLTVMSGSRRQLGWSALQALVDEVEDAIPRRQQVAEDYRIGVQYAMEKVVAIGA